ncbi:hypothetical protein [uncultured Desulfovibrio sp.]|uniref:hypothetical protein n=1 Tax=uncultured Desulfovibrio sp. TaxID=167968 RepID=UPI0026124836|nr:hypothetical protein [uncultured Desulfovibrio sp.]
MTMPLRSRYICLSLLESNAPKVSMNLWGLYNSTRGSLRRPDDKWSNRTAAKGCRPILITKPFHGFCAAFVGKAAGRKGTEICRFTARQSRSLLLISDHADFANMVKPGGSKRLPPGLQVICF